MLLRNIEFYNTPSGEVVISEPHKPIRVLEESDTELINELLDVIRDRFPLAYKRLSENYTRSEKNISHYNYRMVKRFIRCNMGEYDQNHMDIDHNGTFHFEEVRCPLRGECRDECVICKPEMNTSLTAREMDVFRLIVENYQMDGIADELNISIATVNRHRENIKAKLGLRSVKEMITYWFNNHLK